MPRFVVEPRNGPPASSIPALKAEVAKIVGIIEDFNRSAGNEPVQVVAQAWINTTVEIEASDAAAAQLARRTGLKVEKPRKLSRD